MKKKLIGFTGFAIGVLMASPHLGVAQTRNHGAVNAREGTRGGGEAVKDGRHYVLRDLVDPTACVWETGSAVISENPTVLKVLKSISNVDWYFAMDLERTIRAHDFCFTSMLRKIDTTDAPDDRVTEEYEYQVDFEQAGIYTGDQIFIDQGIFQGMTDETKAFLLLHEPMHGYIGFDVPNRNFKLRGMIKTLQRIYQGQLTHRSDLYAAMRGSSVDFPMGTDALDADRALIEYVLSDSDERREKLLKMTDPGTLLQSASIDTDGLTSDDAQTIAEFTSTPIASLIDPFCESQDTQVLDLLSKAPSLSAVDIAGFCLADVNVATTSADFHSYLVSKIKVEASLEGIIAPLETKKVSVVEGRLMIDSIVAELTPTTLDSRTQMPIVQILPAHSDNIARLQPTVKTLLNSIGLLAQAGQIDRIIAMTSGNPEFYTAFSINDALTAIGQASIGAERERPMAVSALTAVFQNFLSIVGDRIAATGGDDAAQKWKASLDSKKLGYSIN